MTTEHSHWQSLLIAFSVYGTLLFVIFRLLQTVLPILVKNKRWKSVSKHFLPLAEMAAWLIFLSWFSFLFAADGHLFGYIVAGLLALLVFWLARYYLRDVVAGIVFNAQRKFDEGDIIQTTDLEGKILHFGLTDIQVLSDDGRKSYVPYSRLLNMGVYSKIEAEQHNKSVNIALVNSSFNDFLKLEKAIRNYCVSLPWVNFSKLVKTILKAKKNGELHVEVNLFLFDIKYFGEVEEALKSEFHNPAAKG